MKPGYRILEHPADLGIESWGATFPDALSMAVSALASILVDSATVEPVEKRPLLVSGNGSETLVVKVLSEVLFLFDGEGFVPKNLIVEELSETSVRGFVQGEPLNDGKHTMRLDVKAITYHQISVRRSSDYVTITVYLDI